MRFCVLQAGSPPRTVPPRCGGYGQMFVDLLAEAGQQWDVFPVEEGVFPEQPLDYDGLVITGSRHSVHDDLDWVRTLLHLIREVHRRERPLLGVCFGHQAIAHALGGEVAPNPKGWDIGIREVFLTPEARNRAPLTGVSNPFRILESHQDVVTRLPRQALRLAGSDFSEHEMSLVCDSTLSLQGHPEFDAEVVRGIIEDQVERQVISASQAREALRSLSDQPDRAFLQGMLKRFLRTGSLT